MNKIIYLVIVILTVSCTVSSKKLASSNQSGFDTNQQSMIMNQDTLDPMRVFLITSKQDSILLRKQSQKVDLSQDKQVLNHFIKRLYRTVRDSSNMGVGIAAPQVGILKDIIWIQRFDKPKFPFEVYINPTIKKYSDKKQPCLEGCLSIPNARDTTLNRAYAILLEYDKIDGSHHYEMVEDFTAVIFQHEIDHLDGILFTDHLKKK